MTTEPFGAELAVTYLKDKARPHVEQLARQLEAPHLLPLYVQVEGQLETVFDRLRTDWGRVDIVMHSLACATKAALFEPLIAHPLPDSQQADTGLRGFRRRGEFARFP